MARVMDWDVKDVLRCYRETVKPEIAEAYHWAMLIYWVRCDKVKDPGKPPELPAILQQD